MIFALPVGPDLCQGIVGLKMIIALPGDLDLFLGLFLHVLHMVTGTGNTEPSRGPLVLGRMVRVYKMRKIM